MKSALFLVIALLLTAGLAAAQEPSAELTQPNEAALMANLAQDGSGVAEDGGCTLPDLTGLSDEEIEAVVREAGFNVAQVAAQPPACPTSFNCNSITNCTKGAPCSITTIGPCCSNGGVNFCCANGGPIKVVQCPCTCAAFPCAVSCPSSTDVRWGC